VEAQGCGTPVIALESGGALESTKSGVFFKEQTSEALIRGIEEFEERMFSPDEVSAKVKSFAKATFCERIKEIIMKKDQSVESS